MYTKKTSENSGLVKLLQNYSKTDETGKEKIKDVAKKVFDIWKITHDFKKEKQYGINT